MGSAVPWLHGQSAVVRTNDTRLADARAPLSAVVPETGTYQVLAADFSGYKTITVSSGTFTITLVASTSQPAAGQYVRIINYGSGVVTVARSGQNINGGTASLTIPAGSATVPTDAFVESDGTNYVAKLNGKPATAGNADTATNGVVSSSPGVGIAHFAGSTQTVTSSAVNLAGGSNEVTGVLPVGNLPVLHGQCTEAWGGSGTAFALVSGDDAIANNTCYNDSGATRTITAVKCRSDYASNAVTVNPTFGSAGTGEAILTGALTCGNSYAYSATGTLDTGAHIAWTTGTGIDPVMAGTLTGSTSIALLIEYTYQPY
jgi:hypothetical protein